ncbi:D-alanyl-D-alanine dipeptidase [Paenibacillus phyllosphaerae]|uniref:D-alanyl-D-alanine dipeptidase n=1 Tax=Paenibacillus phyllosphaerae TaxID=274593 RepID=A0A7W5B2V9_9BACL|nr:D-alanyl-D-alanine dipeptidase [Paenibacillus phyllosphaerae]
MKLELNPIPEFPGMDGWQSIRIEERDEPLISLSCVSERMIVRPYYQQCGIPRALDDVWLREGAAQRLLQALELLPAAYKLVLYDGWRPLAVQRYLYDDFKAKLMREHPSVTGEALDRLVAQYVSLPNTDPRNPSPHLTGGSIDLGLADADGRELDMGSPFDDFTDRSNTSYYETHDVAQGGRYRELRRLLYHVLTEVGFTNYHKEWWHFDYGNQFWAKVKGDTDAVYGYITLT